MTGLTTHRFTLSLLSILMVGGVAAAAPAPAPVTVTVSAAPPHVAAPAGAASVGKGIAVAGAATPGASAALGKPATARATAHAASSARSRQSAHLPVMIAELGPLDEPSLPASPLIKPQAAAAAAPTGTGFLPAPVPNEDRDAPPAANPSAQLGPALLSRKTEFQGHGFANASSQDHGIAEREQPAAGVKISLPVIQ